MQATRKHFHGEIVFLLSILFTPGFSLGQEPSLKKLENNINESIHKVYPACVRMWGFDTVSNQRNSAQFSGVVVSAEGDVYSAAHTVIHGSTYKVFFPDGKEYLAVGLGRISFRDGSGTPDVGTLKLLGKGPWPFVSTRRSSTLRQNEACISVSYPEMLDQPLPTVRFGFITTPKDEWGFIGSTCKMEPGDSGGPLFDEKGNLIGLHSRILADEKENYEIPVDYYLRYRTALQKTQSYASWPEADSLEMSAPINANTYPNWRRMDTLVAKKFRKKNETCFRIISTVRGKIQPVLATLLSSEWAVGFSGKKGHSLLLSKSTMTGDDPVVEIKDGVLAKANVLYRDNESDLVVLQVETKLPGGIRKKRSFRDTLALSDIGRMVYSVIPGNIGRSSVLGSRHFVLPKRYSIGYFGTPAHFVNKKILVSNILPESPTAGKLAVGDHVTGINGIPISQPEHYGAELQKYLPGDTITIQAIRSDSAFSTTIFLPARREGPHPVNHFKGGRSLRLDGFDAVFTHDARVQPEECGSPVYDLEGRFMGINIARFSRAIVVALPVEVIENVLKKAGNL